MRGQLKGGSPHNHHIKGKVTSRGRGKGHEVIADINAKPQPRPPRIELHSPTDKSRPPRGLIDDHHPPAAVGVKIYFRNLVSLFIGLPEGVRHYSIHHL